MTKKHSKKTLTALLAALMIPAGMTCSKNIRMPTYEPTTEYNHAFPLENGDENEVLFLSDKVYNNLSVIYTKHPLEVPICLRGTKNELGYFIQDTYIPVINQSNPISARYDSDGCRQYSDYIGMAHNHVNTNGVCYPSIVDLNRFKSDEQAQIELIFCDVDATKEQGKIAMVTKDITESQINQSGNIEKYLN